MRGRLPEKPDRTKNPEFGENVENQRWKAEVEGTQMGHFQLNVCFQ
jgi:hypothetical protein